MAATLTLEQLSDLAQQILEENRIASASGRVAPALSPRTVRWYTTSGVLDAPGRAGHRAAYGLRHLVQLLRIRQAQAAGASIEEIRQSTALPTEDILDALCLDITSVLGGLDDVPSRPAPPFWATRPTLPDSPAASHIGYASSPTMNLMVRPPAPPAQVRVEHVLRHGPLSIAFDHPPTPAEIDEAIVAAQPLLATLSTPTQERP